MEDAITLSKEVMTGSTACPGCGALLGLKLALQAVPDAILVNSTGCMTLSAKYIKTPLVHTGFNAAGMAKGIASVSDNKVLVYSGDGNTRAALQSLLAMKHENIIYICYNNSGFSNFGHTTRDESIARMFAFNASYLATASVSYPEDFVKKLRKAQTIPGFKFIELMTPCPANWRFDSSYTIEIGRLAVETGIWPLWEMENSIVNLTKRPLRLEPVERYIELQGRFSMPKEKIQAYQEFVNKRWKMLLEGKIL